MLLGVRDSRPKLQRCSTESEGSGGLGYYRRARSLLEGAKTVMSDAKYQGMSSNLYPWICSDRSGRLPEKPDVLEKEIAGVGRYTAGKIGPAVGHVSFTHMQVPYARWPTASERQS